MSILTRIGIGSATIDLIPENTATHLGGRIDASLKLKGGSGRQTVEDIEIALITRYKAEGAEGNSFWKQYGLWEMEFQDDLVVHPDDDRTVAVPPIQVPRSAPVTMGDTTVWIQSALDIDWAVDPSDVDQIEVQPNALLQAVLDALEDHLDLRLLTVENVESTAPDSPQPFVQEFAFDGGNGPFANAFDRLVVTPLQTEEDEGLLLLFRVDRLGDNPVGDKRDGRLRIEAADPNAIADQIHDAVERRL
jgi:sporulation-control protein